MYKDGFYIALLAYDGEENTIAHVESGEKGRDISVMTWEMSIPLESFFEEGHRLVKFLDLEKLVNE